MCDPVAAPIMTEALFSGTGMDLGMASMFGAAASTAAPVAASAAASTFGASDALLAGGTLASAVGTYAQGQAASRIAGQNAATANANATLTEQAGAQTEQAQLTKTQQMVGAQVAAAGAAGIDPASQSLTADTRNTTLQGSMDAAAVRANAAREAWAMRQQASSFSAQSKIDGQSGITGALGTALTGFGKTYLMRIRNQRPLSQMTGAPIGGEG